MPTTENRSVAGLRQNGIVRKINAWMTSPYYVMLIGLLAAVSNIFSAELAVYTFYILCGLYVSFFGDDYLPVMPLVICCYIVPSAGSNPGRNETSVFYPQHGGIYLLVLAVAFFASVIWRIAIDRQWGGKRFFQEKRALLPGMLILGGAYLLGGIGSGFYFAKGINNILFALLQFLSVFFMYWFFTGGVRWEKVRKDYFAWTGLSVGCALVLQIANIYITGNVLVGGSIVREAIATGWGMYNNIGGLLACMIPCAYYLACCRKNGWAYNLLGLVFAGGVVLTCSRSSILGAGAAYVISNILVLRKAESRCSNRIAYVITVSVLVIAVAVLHRQIYQLFQKLLEKGLDPSSRDVIYEEGVKQFLKFPVFGGTFYPTDFKPWEWSTLEAFTSFFPPRWHNTLVQLGASCGTVGLLAYGYHRYQTVKLFVKRRSRETIYIAISIAALLGMSLLDCHIFNVGPTLFYSMLLAFAEKCAVGIEKNM